MSFPLSHKPPYFIPIKSEESMAICAGIVFADIAKPSFDKKGAYFTLQGTVLQSSIYLGKPKQEFKSEA